MAFGVTYSLKLRSELLWVVLLVNARSSTMPLELHRT